MSKCIVYYTCNTHPLDIEEKCRAQLLKSGLPIISVSLSRRIDFGNVRLWVTGKPSIEMMHKQLVYGLNMRIADHVFLCENDVLYHPSHFDFTPPCDDTFYFNTNVYKKWPDGLIVWTDDLQQNSGLCGSRELLLDFFSKRLEQIQREGNNRHYEPGPRYGCKTENWQSLFPNVDIRHEKTLTRSHRSADEFRNPKFAKGFKTVSYVPGWRGRL
jgi:hypothetical protein